MKPPADWSPCQQKGEEHEWFVWSRKQTDLAPDLWDDQSYCCINCGVIIFAAGRAWQNG